MQTIRRNHCYSEEQMRTMQRGLMGREAVLFRYFKEIFQYSALCYRDHGILKCVDILEISPSGVRSVPYLTLDSKIP